MVERLVVEHEAGWERPRPSRRTESLVLNSGPNDHSGARPTAHSDRLRPMRRSTQRAPTVSVRPWATIEHRITIAAMSKIVDEAPTSDFRTKSANSIEATPLGPNQAMNAFWGPGSRLRTKRDQDGERPGDEQRQEDERGEAPDLAVVAGGHDQRPEDEEGQHLRDRADVLGELHEGVRDLVLGHSHHDPGDEGGDQAVADRHVGQPEGREAEADRVDALVASGDPATRAGDGEGARRPGRARCPPGRRSRPRRAAGRPRCPRRRPAPRGRGRRARRAARGRRSAPTPGSACGGRSTGRAEP